MFIFTFFVKIFKLIRWVFGLIRQYARNRKYVLYFSETDNILTTNKNELRKKSGSW